MRQRGFATIFGLCLILVIALIVKGIQESETNHAREVLNFELEQALQSAAESGIIEAAEYVRENPDYLPYSNGIKSESQFPIPIKNNTFEHGEKTINIEVWGERGNIYHCPLGRNTVSNADAQVGVYFMSCATIKGGVLGEDIYRRAYGYVFSEKQEDDTWLDDTTLHFMELPTQGGNKIIKK